MKLGARISEKGEKYATDKKKLALEMQKKTRNFHPLKYQKI